VSSSADRQIDGLIHAYELDGAGGGRPLEWSDCSALEALGKPLWIHFNFMAKDAREWIQGNEKIDPVIADALLDSDSRPRTLNYGAGLLAIFRGVNTNPGADPEDMVSIRIWIDGNVVITTCRRNLLSVEALRQKVAAGDGPKSPAEFLLMLVEQLDDRIDPVVDELDETIEQAELSFEAGNAASYRGEFSAIRRQAARIRRFLSPQRDGLERLARETTSLLTEGDRFVLREESNRLTRQLETLDLVRERAMVAQEEIVAVLAQQQNSRMYLLAIVAAIFLPLSFLTGLLGMNVAGMPGLNNEQAFSIAVVLMSLVGVAIMILFKLKKWL